jgi:aspartyl-tRNA synthetase (EC 6.1.1.12)
MIIDFDLIDQGYLGQIVQVGGFVHSIRDHGGLIFVDLRSNNELIQCVFNPEISPEIFKLAEKLHLEAVVKISGVVKKRDPETINPKIKTGEIEILSQSLEVVALGKPMPFDIHATNSLANEELRLKYRYLDLRRSRVHNLLVSKHRLILDVRNWFDSQGFIEIQTPILANSTPEGARDYLVPSRLHPGKFYALPQAPQQFKQLLMVGGFTRYFQIAPCFRDEDPRADRHPGDFYQIDVEMAWAEETTIHQLCERFINEVLAKHSDKQLLDSHLVRISFAEAMDKYGSDKPDLRYELAWQDAKPVFANSGF